RVKDAVVRLAGLLGVADSKLPTFGYSLDWGTPHIEVDRAGYHYVVVDHGKELKRVSTTELDELLYNAFASITFDLASTYELHHRLPGNDSRRLLFQHQVELMTRLNPEWARRVAKHHNDVLRMFPFKDLEG